MCSNLAPHNPSSINTILNLKLHYSIGRKQNFIFNIIHMVILYILNKILSSFTRQSCQIIQNSLSNFKLHLRSFRLLIQRYYSIFGSNFGRILSKESSNLLILTIKFLFYSFIILSIIYFLIVMVHCTLSWDLVMIRLFNILYGMNFLNGLHFCYTQKISRRTHINTKNLIHKQLFQLFQNYIFSSPLKIVKQMDIYCIILVISHFGYSNIGYSYINNSDISYSYINNSYIGYSYIGYSYIGLSYLLMFSGTFIFQIYIHLWENSRIFCYGLLDFSVVCYFS